MTACPFSVGIARYRQPFTATGFDTVTGIDGPSPKRPHLIRTHKAGIADHVSGQNSGKSALYACFAHGKPLAGVIAV